jgi:hypothetical protein
MTYPVPDRQRQLRATLFQLWAGAYEFAGGEMQTHGDIPDVAKLFFSKFLCAFHPDLILSKEEQETARKVINSMSDGLLATTESRLIVVSEETGVETRLLRAMVHGVAFAVAAQLRHRLSDLSLADRFVHTAADCLRQSVEQLRRRA